MNLLDIINLSYIIASILFIIGIKMMGKQGSARQGNLISSVGMLIAIVVTMLDQHLMSFTSIFAALALGSLIGVILAYKVKMTAMPEMVALLNGFGGLASLLVGWAEFDKIHCHGWESYLKDTLESIAGPMPQVVSFVTSYGNSMYFILGATFAAILIGGITFTGSMLAYAKLAGQITGRAIVFNYQKPINLFLVILTCAIGVIFSMFPELACSKALMLASIGLSFVLGILCVLPIGGGDMPVVISLLNSLSGLAAAAAGFIIANNVLIVSGCLVGTSGIILSIIMCKSMNRSIKNVLLGGFGSKQSTKSEKEAEPKDLSAEDAYFVLESARNVLVVPGYGMAVAQAQHAVKEFAKALEENGAEVHYAIHPVAGRMPGHMNVLLAEADVPYEQLIEMDAANAMMPNVDVAIVIGANDVVNPAATMEKASPIYGMPIINVHEAKTVFVLKRGKGADFSGLPNRLFSMDNVRMIYGDAKSTVTALAHQFKSNG